MKSLTNTELSHIQGGGWWTEFTDGACTAVAVIDVAVGAAAYAGAAVGNPLAISLIVASAGCAVWGAYRLSE